MAEIKPVVRVELDPSKPVPEVCQVIMALTPYHAGHEESILRGIQDAIQQRLDTLKGDDEGGEPVRKPKRSK